MGFFPVMEGGCPSKGYSSHLFQEDGVPKVFGVSSRRRPLSIVALPHIRVIMCCLLSLLVLYLIRCVGIHSFLSQCFVTFTVEERLKKPGIQ